MRSVVSAVALILIAPSGLAQTTRTYSYDALGRLVKVTPGTGTPVCYTHDAADNRTTVTATTGCTVGGGGGGGNSPPTAVDDWIFVEAPSWSGNIGALANDTDPNLPSDTLSVVSVSGTSNASIVGGGADVYYSGTAPGETFSYTMRDAAGATSSATITVSIFWIECGPVEC